MPGVLYVAQIEEPDSSVRLAPMKIGTRHLCLSGYLFWVGFSVRNVYLNGFHGLR